MPLTLNLQTGVIDSVVWKDKKRMNTKIAGVRWDFLERLKKLSARDTKPGQIYFLCGKEKYKQFVVAFYSGDRPEVSPLRLAAAPK